jgi:hypothetical protein
MEAGIVDQDYQIVAAYPEIFLQSTQQVVMRPNLGDHLDHPERG